MDTLTHHEMGRLPANGAGFAKSEKSVAVGSDQKLNWNGRNEGRKPSRRRHEICAWAEKWRVHLDGCAVANRDARLSPLVSRNRYLGLIERLAAIKM